MASSRPLKQGKFRPKCWEMYDDHFVAPVLVHYADRLYRISDSQQDPLLILDPNKCL